MAKDAATETPETVTSLSDSDQKDKIGEEVKREEMQLKAVDDNVDGKSDDDNATRGDQDDQDWYSIAHNELDQESQDGSLMQMDGNSSISQQFPRPIMQAPDVNYALTDYQMQLLLLEQQRKTRLLAARAEQGGGPEPEYNSALPDHQWQMIEPEQEDEKDLRLQPQPKSQTGQANSALMDYQMQLMLLETQNKTRLMRARAGQDVQESEPEPRERGEALTASKL
ncbi:hypothetical protein VMCG_07634 [Cytospora schulzeri]|uniref:Uncharacterized protein n=1 Tax=Cytospora schulzeri TaxID=448051 RepID=A0A423VX70_9PEZI|nr:hypothetical protein VMCG_07634 [Valsa malicola]